MFETLAFSPTAHGDCNNAGAKRKKNYTWLTN